MWWESDECAHLPVPRVVAEGTELGGYDIAWIVQERIAGQTVAKQIHADRLRQLFLAAARFHAHTREIKRAERIEPAGEPDWRSVLDRWHARPMDTWCHGDLHPGNCMIRDECSSGADGTQADPRCGVLIDFSLVHPGHWVEDALYLERMYWGREDALMGVEPVRCLAEYRLLLGLHADDTAERLADIRRLLRGVTSPAFLRHENDPVYLDAALERVLKLIPKTGGSL
jgi:aminoglycoside phosphotransferase (APT) family kinase protein